MHSWSFTLWNSRNHNFHITLLDTCITLATTEHNNNNNNNNKIHKRLSLLHKWPIRVWHSQVPTRFRKTLLPPCGRNSKEDSLEADLKAHALLTSDRADSTSAMCNTPAGPGYTPFLSWLFSPPASSKMGSSLLLLPIKFHFKSQNSSKQRLTPDSLTKKSLL